MQIGLYIIGDEILGGRRRDTHLSAMIERLKPYGKTLNWVRILGDDFSTLVENFRQSLASGAWVLSTGGIGGTPDDLTRQALAEAADIELVPHPEGLAILREKYGDELTPERRRMVEFPEGATLIPNPVNRIPGFSFRQHHCVPGFPQMAWPMIEWVLAQAFGGQCSEAPLELAVKIKGTPESKLISLMERLLRTYPGVKVFSLPSIAPNEPCVELGVRGPADKARAAMREMQSELTDRNIEWEEV
ncbi:MAG TPA: molybdopterin-binding protein [Gammaproteobacteria bacterium]